MNAVIYQVLNTLCIIIYIKTYKTALVKTVTGALLGGSASFKKLCVIMMPMAPKHPFGSTRQTKVNTELDCD